MNNPDIVERLEDYAEDDYYFDHKGSLVTTNRPIALREAAAEITRLREDNKKLSDKAEALRKDAELYRSLREIYSGLFCGMHGMSPYVVFNKPLIQPMYFKPDMLDAAIAATKEQQA